MFCIIMLISTTSVQIHRTFRRKLKIFAYYHIKKQLNIEPSIDEYKHNFVRLVKADLMAKKLTPLYIDQSHIYALDRENRQVNASVQKFDEMAKNRIKCLQTNPESFAQLFTHVTTHVT